MASEAEILKEAIEVENHAHAVVLAALNDADFMRGVLQAQEQEVKGQPGEAWSSVKARLGIA